MGSVPASLSEPSVPRVLIVDDDVSVTDMFSRTLRLDGYEVWSALAPAEGLELARTHRPDAIIVDLRMPVTGGIRLLQAIRRLPDLAAVPAAIVTGDYYVGRSEEDAVAALGAQLRFKPLWLDELVTLARELLARNPGDARSRA